MQRLYSSDAFDTDQRVPSWWEASAIRPSVKTTAFHNQKCFDVAIIGGGYTGQSAALHLARDGQRNVVVLDAADAGWGASGRNGGFCCVGGTRASYAALLRRYGLDETRQLVHAQLAAIELVADLAAEYRIELQRSGSGELQLGYRRSAGRNFGDEQQFWQRYFRLGLEVLDSDALRERGYHASGARAGLLSPYGFGLHPLQYCLGLQAACLAHGVNWFAHTPVTAWQEIAGEQLLHTPKGVIRARQVVIASNGYTPEDLHPGLVGCLLPVMSSIVVTRPLSAGELASQGWSGPGMAYDDRQLLHYFRVLPDQRLLFGGRGGVNAAAATLPAVRANLEKALHACFPAWRAVDIEYCWRGFACLAYRQVPHVAALSGSRSVYCALAYHGNGVAMGTWAGQQVARLVMGQQHRIPGFMQRPPARFPLPGWRLMYLRAAYLAFQLNDRLN